MVALLVFESLEFRGPGVARFDGVSSPRWSVPGWEAARRAWRESDRLPR